MPKLSSQTVTMLDGGAGVLLPRSWMPRLSEVHLHFSDCLLPNTDHGMCRSSQRGCHGIINCIADRGKLSQAGANGHAWRAHHADRAGMC